MAKNRTLCTLPTWLIKGEGGSESPKGYVFDSAFSIKRKKCAKPPVGKFRTVEKSNMGCGSSSDKDDKDKNAGSKDDAGSKPPADKDKAAGEEGATDSQKQEDAGDDKKDEPPKP